ncbi:g protein-coupled receptor-related [Anaeramoeba ignava]|uniref:G protein-coupled receptor-related n=1 Tax=Anaeramoeba ignava TaxID=1746090 RepID=A0A9Q0LJH2_ANAIG|nr:g protein-coupled receptor-related [Anaeramoeba ignava]
MVNLSDFYDGDTYPLNCEIIYNFTGTLSNVSNVTFYCTSDECTPLTLEGQINIFNSQNVIFDGSNCSKLEIKAPISISSNSNVTFKNTSFYYPNKLISEDSIVYLDQFYLENATMDSNPINGTNSVFVISNLGINGNWSTLSFVSDQEVTNSSTTINNCNGNFKITSEGVPLQISSCSDIDILIKNSQLTINSTEITLYQVKLDNSNFQMQNASIFNLTVFGNSNISGTFLEISELLYFGADEEAQSFVFVPTSISSNFTIEENSSVFFDYLTLETGSEFVNISGKIGINYQFTTNFGNYVIPNLFLYKSSLLKCIYSTLEINNTLSFYGNLEDEKIINCSLNFTGKELTSESTQVQIQKKFSISPTGSCQISTNDLYLIVNNSVLEANYQMNLSRLDFLYNTILNSTLYPQLNVNITLFIGNSTIQNVDIYSNSVILLEYGLVEFQDDTNLYSLKATSPEHSNYTLYGNGSFHTNKLEVEGDLDIDEIFFGKEIEIAENGKLFLSDLTSNSFSQINITLNGSLTISNSSIEDPFDIFIFYSQNLYQLNFIDSQFNFNNKQFDLPNLKLENSNISYLQSNLSSLLLEGLNLFQNSTLQIQDGLIQAEESQTSTLYLNSSNFTFGNNSGFNLNSSSSISIYSFPNSQNFNFSSLEEKNQTFIISFDSCLLLDNVEIEVVGDDRVDFSGELYISNSIFTINSSNIYFGKLEIVGINSEVDLQNDINIQNLTFSSGKLNFTKIISNNSNSLFIFGDGTDQTFFNEGKTSQANITSSGSILIKNNISFPNIAFQLENTSNLNIQSLNFTTSSNSSIINNYGKISINGLDQINSQSSPINFGFFTKNYQVSEINCSGNTKFSQIVVNYGKIQTSTDLSFEMNLFVEEGGMINGSGNEKPNIVVNEDLYITGETQINFVDISANQTKFISFSNHSWINISNSNFTTQYFIFDTTQILSEQTIFTVFQETQFFKDCLILPSDLEQPTTSEFWNNGDFVVDSRNVTFLLTLKNYGSFSANSSFITFSSLENYNKLNISYSNIALLNDSLVSNSSMNNSIEDTQANYFINSTINIKNESSNLYFQGQVKFENGIEIYGNFTIKEDADVILELEKESTQMIIHNTSTLQSPLWLVLLRSSPDEARNYSYNAIYLVNNQTFNMDMLNSTDEQHINFSRNNEWITAIVAGCPQGEYSSGFDKTCHGCGEGNYNDIIGASKCQPCPEGNFSNQTGQSQCQPCSPGSYQQSTEQTSCSLCEIGTYTSKNGSAHCIQCQQGYYNTENGSTNCSVCKKGYYSQLPSQCIPCPTGEYSSIEGSFTCYYCPAGSYSSKEGASSCSTCPSDTYQKEIGQESCIDCPTNSGTSGVGSSSEKDCLCSIGYYGEYGSSCKLCPSGGICDDIGVVVPDAEPGYWHSSSDPTSFFQCAVSAACPGGGTDTCNENIGYSGNLCAVCLSGFYKFGGECMKCPQNQNNRLILMSFFVILLCLFLFIIARKVKNYFASFSIMFSFFQVLAVIAGLKANWPDSINSTWRSLSVFNFNIDYLAVECTVPLTYTQKWWICMSFPFILFFVLLFVYLVVFLHSKTIEKCGSKFMNKFPSFCERPTRQTTNKYLYIFSWARFKFSQLFTHGFGREQRKTLYNNLINSYSTILSFLYLFLSYKVLQVFDCRKQSSGVYLFEPDTSLFCYHEWWMRLLPWAILFFVIYVVGIPLTLAILFFVSSKKMDEKTFDLHFGLLCARYTKRWFFWEIVIMIRKLFMTISQLFFSFDAILQLVVSVVILLASLVLQVQTKPFVSNRHNTLEFVLISFSEIILFSGMVFVSNDLQSSRANNILAIVIISLIWISLTVLVFMILFEIRHRLRVKKGRDVDEIQKSVELSSGKTVINFLASKPSFFLIWNWVLQNTDHKAKLLREFYKQIKDFYSKNESQKEMLNIEEFWKSFLEKWNPFLLQIIQNWFNQASLLERIQFANILSKIRFEIFLNNSNLKK